jgi:hypothetical protein
LLVRLQEAGRFNYAGIVTHSFGHVVRLLAAATSEHTFALLVAFDQSSASSSKEADNEAEEEGGIEDVISALPSKLKKLRYGPAGHRARRRAMTQPASLVDLNQ